MKRHVVEIEVECKKNERRKVAFVVRQAFEWPSLGGRPDWSEWCGSQLFRRYGNPPSGIGKRFEAFQLREGVNADNLPEKWDRTHLAGYVTYPKYGEAAQRMPGEIVLRGQGLGELEIDFEAGVDGCYALIRVRNGNVPTIGEREFIVGQIIPKLEEFARINAAGLYAEAVAAIEAALNERLEAAEKQLARRREEAAEAVNNLKKGM